MDATKIGIAIKHLRKEAGFTQHELAQQLNVTDKAVSKWERGLSVPSIAIITKLSNLLNCDVDNLLEGNITYLEKSWVGLLDLNNGAVFCGSAVYGKPLVYFFLSYFMLAGIRHIYILCEDKDKQFIEKEFGNGDTIGISITFINKAEQLPVIENTMVVFDNPFIYGLNLTKFFQRAMSRNQGVSILTSSHKKGKKVSYDSNKRVIALDENGYACVPVAFVPKKYHDIIEKINDIEGLISLKVLFAEPMGNGMIEFSIKNEDDIMEAAKLLQLLKKQMGIDAYNLTDIAKNRHLTG